MWGPSFDISTHNRSCFLLEDDIARLNIYDIDQIRREAKSLLSQATALVCLANVRVEKQKKNEGKETQQIAEL